MAGTGPDRPGLRPERLNHKWYRDGTEIPTDEGKLYLDSVLDMGSRRIVGFGIGEHHDADLATTALQMAVAVRGGKDNIGKVIMHTDSEYENAGVPGFLDSHADGPVRMLVSRLSPGILTRTSD